MIPYIHIEPLRVGPLAIQPFGVLVATGVLVGIALATRRARRLGMDVAALQSFITWTLVGGFVAGHVLDTIFYHPHDVLERPWTLLMLWSGLSSFGGFVGAALGAVAWKYFETTRITSLGRWDLVRLVRRAKPVSFLAFSDVILAVFPIAWSFGRAGCSVVHDHPGARAARDAWLAVAYGPGPVDHYWFLELRHGIEPRYDLGLLEMLFTILLAVAFAATWRRGRADGWYAVAICLLNAPVRFLLDFLRVNDAEGGDPRYGSLTPAQWACIVLALVGVGLAVRLRREAGRTSLRPV